MPKDEWEEFNKDPRTKCKYGEKCYQRNPEHHKTYKHPPHTPKIVQDTRVKRKFSPFTRKPRDPDKKKAPVASMDKQGTEEKVSVSREELKSEESDERPTISNTPTNSSFIEDTVNILEELQYYEKDVDHKLLKELFLVDMPSDFYKLFECLNQDSSIEKVLDSVNLQLIGPYDLILGKLPVLEDKDLYLVHWRFFYDPPEFQTVLKKKGTSQFHIGYYRDSPEEKPAFVATNDSEMDYKITPVADNIIGAVYLYLENEKKKSPFTAMSCQSVMEKLKKVAEEEKFSLQKYSMKKRQAQMVTKTLHGAGIVVPYNKKTQLGYRLLAETDTNLKKIFKKLQDAKTQSEKDGALSELQPVITYASIAVDECDFGTGLEAGIDMFCSGLRELHSSVLSSLISVYSLLKRDAFGKIIKVHLKYRRKGASLSVLDFK